jgi:hypothetical protein
MTNKELRSFDIGIITASAVTIMVVAVTYIFGVPLLPVVLAQTVGSLAMAAWWVWSRS